MNKVTFQFEEKGKQPIILEIAKGDTILEAALMNNIELHHNCGGVCACSTCHIYINTGDGKIEPLNDKEEDFIDRAKNPKLNSRLACQCVMLQNESEINITVPDQSVLLGD
jgi:2Fe-2S ferredoxin